MMRGGDSSPHRAGEPSKSSLPAAPHPTSTILEKRTIQNYDEIATSWAKEMNGGSDWVNEYALFKEFLPSGKILELGCGGGRDAKELLKLGYTYVGTDASKGMIDVARKTVPEADFRVMNMYDISEFDEPFDGFWACAALLHIPKSRIQYVFEQLTRVLRDGAIGFITIKDGDKEDFEVRDKNGRHEERLFVYWQKEEFDDVLKHNGYDVLQYEHRPISERTRWHIYFLKKLGKNWGEL